MATVAQLKNLYPVKIPDWTVTLDGHSLWSKGGFNDGDLLDGMLEYDRNLYEFDDMLYGQTRGSSNRYITILKDIALIALVELFLLPKFDRPLTLYHANYLHNPCRVEEDEWWPQEQWDYPLPEVVIEGQTVSSMFYSLKDVFEATLANKPVTFPSCLKQTALIYSGEMEYPVAISDHQLENGACFPSPLQITDTQSS